MYFTPDYKSTYETERREALVKKIQEHEFDMDKMREDKSADVYLKYKYYKIVDFYVPDTGKNNGKLVIKLEELSVYEPEETDDEASLYSGYSV